MLHADKIDDSLIASLDVIVKTIRGEHPNWKHKRITREANKRQRAVPKISRYFKKLGAGDHPIVTPIIREKLIAAGTKGGLASRGKTSPEKAAASRANGKLGGRPKGSRKTAQAT